MAGATEIKIDISGEDGATEIGIDISGESGATEIEIDIGWGYRDRDRYWLGLQR